MLFGVVDQLQQTSLDVCVYASWDRGGGQSQRDFPSIRCNSTACSVTVARNRSISALASSSTTCSAVLPGRPGLAAANASKLPYFAVRMIVLTVDRSMPHFAATCACVRSLVVTSKNTSYFCEGLSTRLRRRPFPDTFVPT